MLASLASSADPVGEVSNAAISAAERCGLADQHFILLGPGLDCSSIGEDEAVDSVFQSTFTMAYTFKADRSLD